MFGRSDEPETKAGTIPGKRVETLISLACAFLILLHLIASFFPRLRLWGVSQLGYFSLEFRLALSAVALLILIPAVNKPITRALTVIFARIADSFRKTNRRLLYLAISLISLIPFWLLRAETPLLGDGYLRAGELKFGVLLYITEPLDFHLHLLVYRLCGLDGQTTYAILSCLAGGLYVFLALVLSHTLGKDTKERLLVFLILATTGATQLFFGYVESYSCMYVGVVAYIFFGIRHLQGKSGFIWACLSLLLAVSFHLSALFVLPSLLFLALAGPSESAGRKGTSRRFTNLVTSVCLTFIIAGGIQLLRTRAHEESPFALFIHPFGGVERFYSFFSPAHFLDFINHQLLISPVGPVLWIVLPALFWRKIDFRDNVIRFLIWITACSYGFALLVDPKLGYARDWDLFALCGLGPILLGLYLASGLLGDRVRAAPGAKPEPAGRRASSVIDLRGVTLVLAATSLFSTLPWILINATEQKAVARFEDLLKMDEVRAAHGWETVACYFRDRGEYQKTVRLWQNAVALKPIPRYFAVLGNAYLKLEKYDEAIRALERSIQMAPNRVGIEYLHRSLGVGLAAKGRYDEAVSHLRKAIDLAPGRPEFHYIMGNTLANGGRYEEAVPYFETVLGLNPGHVRTYKLLGVTLARLGREEEAKSYLESYMRLAPQDATGVKGLIDSIEIRIDSGR